jgi:hypothetical protein
MKTTVEISDALLKEAKEFAAREGTSVRALIEAGLRSQLETSKKQFRLRDGSFRGKGLRPEWRDVSWQSIIDASYEGRGG